MSAPVYHGYSVSALESLYSHRHRIDGYDGYLERWPSESGRALERFEVLSDLAYGPHPLERYDAFPAGPAAPVLVFFHGGYWHSQDKRNFLFPAPAFVDAGIAFVSANYPLCPEVGIPELINSCRQCIAHIHRNAGRFGGDPDRIHVAGHSAGAHIAAMLLSAERASSGKPTAPAPIRGALAISGVYDLTPIRYLAMNERLRIPLADVASVSPIQNVPKRGCRLVLAVGDGEGKEFLRQQQAYADAWRTRGHACDEIVVAGANHFSILDELSHDGGALFQAVRKMMERE